jgi:hypothetical protein
MNVRYHVDGHLSEDMREAVEREMRFLDTRLATFADDLTSLDVTVRSQSHAGNYTSKLVLRLPSRTIAVEGDGPSRPAALRDAFAVLRDRLDEHLAKLRGEPAIRRAGRRERDMVGDPEEELVHEGMDRDD